MGNSDFQFKKFTVKQDKTAMKVGTDGVLIGAWANPIGAGNILDIGTGTGLIALMMAQKSNACITGIEKDKKAFMQAKENAANCPWYDRIGMINCSFQDYYKSTSKKFDLIISNPPYFTKSLQAPDKKRSLARHDHSLPKSELLKGVSQLLGKNGEFYIILPMVTESDFIPAAKEHNLHCTRKMYVRPTIHKSPKRIMMVFSLLSKECTVEYMAIERDKRHEYTREYRELTKDFYRAF